MSDLMDRGHMMAELHPHPCDWEGGKTVGTVDEVFQNQCFSCAYIIIGVHKGTR